MKDNFLIVKCIRDGKTHWRWPFDIGPVMHIDDASIKEIVRGKFQHGDAEFVRRCGVLLDTDQLDVVRSNQAGLSESDRAALIELGRTPPKDGA